jgi:hypothetical protein
MCCAGFPVLCGLLCAPRYFGQCLASAQSFEDCDLVLLHFAGARGVGRGLIFVQHGNPVFVGQNYIAGPDGDAATAHGHIEVAAKPARLGRDW